MLGPVLTLVFLGVALGWAVFLRAGVYPSDWATAIPLIGCTSFLYWLFVRRSQMAPPLRLWVRIAIWSVPCYVVFQLLPLPLPLLRAMSPARAALVEALRPVIPAASSAPLSVNAPAAVMWLFNILCYIATFFLVRELCWRFSKRAWATVIPLIVIGGIEAIIGIFQVWNNWPNGVATGTYTDPDHFCGLLEMVLPLTAVYGWAVLRRRGQSYYRSAWPPLAACTVWAVAGLLLAAIVNSHSRMGLLNALCSLFVIGALSFGPQQPSVTWRIVPLSVLAVGALALFIVLPPDQLIEQLAEMSSSNQVSADTRVYLWKETLPLVSEFFWFGTGLGGFESTFLKYQGIASALRMEMAHNDYLQYLAELGAVGFSLLTAALTGILIPIVRGILRLEDDDRRLLLIGCAGGFVAIALHSLVDSNLYIPANAMVLAWISGVASFNGLE